MTLLKKRTRFEDLEEKETGEKEKKRRFLKKQP
jgi:hypothetical protein